MFLGFLFLGVSIVADIFMEAIEVITSQTRVRQLEDKETGKTIQVEEQVWNPTIANLTLMALGSSAPEILLAVIEALGTLGEPAGPLGAATIVGSAAFNLLVISAVAVVAVDAPKKIRDVGVFATTAIFSIFAYCWLYVCLVTATPEIVTRQEAWLTILFFCILVGLAFAADRCFAAHLERSENKEQAEEKAAAELMAAKRHELRQFAKTLGGDRAVIEVAQGISSTFTNEVSEQDKNGIIRLYREILGTDNLAKVSAKELHAPLQPASLLERFAARKANNLGGHKDFLALQGMKGQIENAVGKVEQENEDLGFKCLHYSVTESSGHVELTVVKKVLNADLTFGVRTIDATAQAPRDYTPYEEIHTMRKRDTELKIPIQIIDNTDWQPDLEFTVELYDPNTNEKFFGDDTTTKVTILDEDFPGKLGFATTDIKASKLQDRVDIKIVRSEGSSGKISCMLRTE
jgi:solute carrier family 8 (sodium/calcium exchanger)